MISAEKVLSLPKLGKDDSFSFGCSRCGKCCRNREDILLTPLDLFKIARHLNKTITEILEEYCECYEGEHSQLPVVRIEPREYRRTCPFAAKEGCRIHPVKPVVCALFPLGRMTDAMTKEFSYFLHSVSCGSRRQTRTVRQWLDDFSILDEEAFTVMWHQKFGELSEILRDLYSRISFSHEAINSMLMVSLYISYDLNKDFTAQFTANCAEALRLVKMIAEKLSETSGEGM